MCEYFIMTSAVSGFQPVVDNQINTNANTYIISLVIYIYISESGKLTVTI